jgi:hypothetical protein
MGAKQTSRFRAPTSEIDPEQTSSFQGAAADPARFHSDLDQHPAAQQLSINSGWYEPVATADGVESALSPLAMSSVMNNTIL